MREIVSEKDIMLYKADCLEVMPPLPESSTDLVLCDLPFGVMASQWDKIIPFSKMWEETRRVRRDNAPTALFGSGPLSSLLRCGNLVELKCDWVWEKSKAGNFLLVKKQPLKAHKLVGILCNGKTPYYPIMEEGEPYEDRIKRGNNWIGVDKVPNSTFRNENKGTRYPRSVKYFKTVKSKGKTIHVNQRPVVLLKYLIKTYTREDDTVLDSASGNISTVTACIHTNRKCICIEKDDMHFLRGEERIRSEYNIKRNVE